MNENFEPKINKKEKFPAIEVENEVIWINKNLEAPFSLEIGKQSNLGLMLKTDDARNNRKDFELTIKSGHTRSAEIGKVIFADQKRKNVYRDIDIKGAGYAVTKRSKGAFYDDEPDADDMMVKQYENWHGSEGIMGLMDAKSAFHDAQMSEEFTKMGIRTHRVLTITEIKELYFNGRLISVEEIKNASRDGRIRENSHEYIQDDFIPVLQVRAYGLKDRIQDNIYQGSIASRESIEDAINFVGKELNDDSFDVKKYLHWFAENLGKNIGLIHKNGYSHNFLSGHNITLDCRVVDLDSVSSLSVLDDESIKRKMQEDVDGNHPEDDGYNGGLQSLRILSKNIIKVFPEEEKNIDVKKLEGEFLNSYKKYFKDDSDNIKLPVIDKEKF